MCALEFSSLICRLACLDLIDLTIQVFLTLTEAFHSVANLRGCLGGLLGLSWRPACPLARSLLGHLLSQRLGLSSLDLGHLVSVQDFDLRHLLNDLQPVVGFLGKRVTKEVQLLEECKLGQELKEDIQVSELVVSDEEHLEELKLLDAFD